MSNIRRHLTYANLMSTLAVFLLLGGAAVAAKKLSGKDIKKNAIAAKHIKKNAVKGKHVKQDALGGDDIDESKLDSSKLNISLPASGGPAAYARVKPDGTLADAKGITSSQVHKPGPGSYCFDIEGIKHVQVTPIVPEDGVDDTDTVSVLDKATLADFTLDIAAFCSGKLGQDFVVGYDTAFGAEDAYFYVSFWK